MLAFKYRFHGHGSLRYVYKNGSAVRSHLLTVKYSKHPTRANPRFAVVVSKKVHKSAVGRNKIRRRIYEIIRAELLRLKTSDTVIIVVSSEVLNMSYQELAHEISELFTSANLYK